MQYGDGQIGRTLVGLSQRKKKKGERTCPAAAVCRGTAFSGGVVNVEVVDSGHIKQAVNTLLQLKLFIIRKQKDFVAPVRTQRCMAAL
jgi:hypothetical protein